MVGPETENERVGITTLFESIIIWVQTKSKMNCCLQKIIDSAVFVLVLGKQNCQISFVCLHFQAQL